MKKFISVIIALALMLSVAACVSEGGNGGTANVETNGQMGNIDEPVATGELFIWSQLTEGAIEGLTETGLQATNIEFPANCKKVSGIRSEKLVKVSFANADTELSSDAFSGCTALKQIELPTNLQEIPKRAFNDCVSLEVIVIPAGVSKIGTDCFWSCKSLTEIVLPDGLEIINRSAFKECVGLRAVQIPGNVAEIGEDAFRECTGLKEVIFSNGVELIGDGAFEKCVALEKVELKEGTKTLGAKAFAFCDSIKEIHLPASLESVENDSIVQTHGVDVYVKAGSYMDQRLESMSESDYYNKIAE